MDALLTVAEVAEMLKLNPQTVPATGSNPEFRIRSSSP